MRRPALACLAVIAATGALAADPPYDPLLLRLAEILGSLHYLDRLCGDPAPPWRTEMEGLIETEAPDDARKARIVDRFNLGFSSYAAVYRTCTEAAEASLDRYREEGARIAAEIATRYGPLPGSAAPAPAGDAPAPQSR